LSPDNFLRSRNDNLLTLPRSFKEKVAKFEALELTLTGYS